MGKIKKRRYRIKVPKRYGEAEHPVKIVMIGDLHNTKFGEGNELLVEAIAGEHPDLIFSVGDLTVAKPGRETHLEIGMRLIKRLSYECPVYCIHGNHEYRTKVYPKEYEGKYAELKRSLDMANVYLLENDNRQISVNGLRMNIYGLEIPMKYFVKFQREMLTREEVREHLGESSDDFNILLAHNPLYFDAYAKWGANLTLSGHVHGGFVRLPLIGGVISPQAGLFPRYSCGLYEKYGKKLIVTAGLGTHSFVPRINNPAEVTVIELY